MKWWQKHGELILTGGLCTMVGAAIPMYVMAIKELLFKKEQTMQEVGIRKFAIRLLLSEQIPKDIKDIIAAERDKLLDEIDRQHKGRTR